jgi:5-methylphenazine-1-carboxylate 1-monooxygenase
VLNDITLRNRRLGPEAALQLAEERAPEGFDRIEDVIAPDEIKSISDSFFAAAGLDVKTVNSRPPYVPATMSREAHPD